MEFTFDKWFKGQSKVVRVILLIIPFVNWIMEILTRISAFMRKNSDTNLIAMILFIIPWSCFLAWIDALWVALKDEQVLMD